MELFEADAVSTDNLSESALFARESEPPILRNRSCACAMGYVSNTEHQLLMLIEPLQKAALLLNRGGQILSCNELFARLIGSPRSIVLGQIFASYLVNDEEDAFHRLLKRTISGIGFAEFHLLHMDQSIIQVRISLRVLPVQIGSASIICVIVDALSINTGSFQVQDTSLLRLSATQY